MNIAFYGKTMVNMRKRQKIESIQKNDNEKVIKQLSKLTFNGFYKAHTNCDSYIFDIFEENEVPLVMPIYLGFAVLELTKFLTYKPYYDKLQPFIE